MKRHIRPKHIVRLPKGSVSPTGSIYREYDIVIQNHVLVSYPESQYIIRSHKPFKLRYELNGKIHEVSSHKS